MMKKELPYFSITSTIKQVLKNKLPCVALESAVITHGLPYPQNLSLALEVEKEILETGASPATIGVLEGIIYVGLDQNQIKTLAQIKNPKKINGREFSNVIANRGSGGTTVAGTLVAAHMAGIPVFATGGIGGVHRNAPFDISADLPQLSKTPVIVVCSGAKSILDIQATLEYLETWSIPVIGYQTNRFPAFFSSDSGFKTSGSVNSPADAAVLAKTHWQLGMNSSVIITVPPPKEYALPLQKMNKIIEKAVSDAKNEGIIGQEVTPYLLKRVVEYTQGDSLKVNLALLKNNAAIAAQIAVEFAKV